MTSTAATPTISPDLNRESDAAPGVFTDAASTRHRNDIQGLRAVAVLLVVLNHAGVGFLGGGYVGVDVFFVLSGFLITQLLLTRRRSRRGSELIDFYIRRGRRILPAAVLALVVTDIAAAHLLNYVRARAVMHDSISSALFAANIHFADLNTNYFARGQPVSPLQHFWSLSVEEQFYAVWPLLFGLVVFGLLRRRSPHIGKGALIRLLVVVGVIEIASLIFSISYTRSNVFAAYFATRARVWELGLGAALAIALPWIRSPIRKYDIAAGWIGLIMILAAAVLFTSGTQFPGDAALLPTLGAVLVIAAGVPEVQSRWSAARYLGVGPMRFIGDRSYSWYLWHFPFLIIFADHVGHPVSLGVNLLLVGCAFLLSIVTYAAVENPMRRLQWNPPRLAIVMWPASVVIVCLVAFRSLLSVDAAHPPPAPTVLAARAALTSLERAGSTQAVQNAVLGVRSNASLPAGVTAAVGSSDRYWGYSFSPESCVATTGQTSSDICRFGDRSADRVLTVIGDSHAQMWMPALINWGRRNHWTVIPLVKESCTVEDWVTEPSSSECLRWYRWMTGEVKHLRPQVAMIAGYYNDPAIDSHSAEYARSGFQMATDSIRPLTQRAIVLLDAPSQTRQPVDCLLTSHATMATCADRFSDQAVLLRQQLIRQADADGASYVDPTGWFCADRICPMVIGGQIAYLDKGHVSGNYASDVAPLFGQALNRAIMSGP